MDRKEYMKVNLEHYKIFYFVAKNKSITAAAKELYLSQPTISKYIQNLEKELGMILFIRSKKGVVLTPEAEMLYEHVSKAYRHIDLAEEELMNRRELQEGILHIGASEMTMQHFLLSYLEKYKTWYPNIRLKISNCSTPSAVEKLRNGIIDMAVIITPMEAEDLNIYKLKAFKDVFIAKKGHPLCEGRVSLRELCCYPFVCLEKGTISRKYLEELFLAEGEGLVPDIELASTDLIAPAVAYGLGIGFVPYNFAAAAIREGTVELIDVAESLQERYICAVTLNSRPLSSAAQKMMKLLIEREEGFR
ncbi:LysR family transcriptional regulator [Anaerocolumna xylanovorans]|uniref:DNA-binding transcriptional regulator, LysR family n=1 Tax=Anaerocolumna xylanovorans DSM 12503 TaxID=1121345 RepID=A0A1M7XX24_9FIRM|nr:LysR family transcriptional regulator [Anaerocolumna xylanovorans]SHO43385.1 DNA-binding transcriptional regulator, LysR family [Anaerocolumna xylanovorans DSM 12503]